MHACQLVMHNSQYPALYCTRPSHADLPCPPPGPHTHAHRQEYIMGMTLLMLMLCMKVGGAVRMWWGWGLQEAHVVGVGVPGA